MENSSLIFEQKHMMAFVELRNLSLEIDRQKERMDAIKETLFKGMEENGIKSIDNKYVTITYVDASPGKPALDEKTWKAEDPESYRKVFNEYNKMAGQKKAHIRIKAKKAEDDTE